MPGWLRSEGFWKDRQGLGKNWGEELLSKSVGEFKGVLRGLRWVQSQRAGQGLLFVSQGQQPSSGFGVR